MSGCHSPYIPVHPGKSDVEKLQERIDKLELEHLNKLSPGAYTLLKSEIKELEDKIYMLENHVKEMTEAYLKKLVKNAKPHKCPTCYGQEMQKLKVKDQGDNHFEMVIDCHSCKGTGIVWG